MSVDNRFTGKDLYVKFNTTVLSGDHTSFGWDEAEDTADLTAGADSFHYYVPMRQNCTFSFDTWMNGSTLTTWDAIAPGSVGSLEVGPFGTASGKPKFSWTRVVVNGRSPSVPYDGGVVHACKFQGSSIGTATYY